MMVHLAVTGNFIELINVGAVFSRMGSHPFSCFAAVVATGLIFFVAKLTLFIPVVGIFAYAIATVVASIMVSSLWAQIYRR
jgi:hypothetical protein